METDKINHTSKAVSHTAKDRQEGEGVVGRCPDFMGYGSCHMTVEAHFHFKGGWLFRPRQYPVPTILHPKGAHTKGPHNILSQGGPQYPVPRGSTVSGGGGGGGAHYSPSSGGCLLRSISTSSLSSTPSLLNSPPCITRTLDSRRWARGSQLKISVDGGTEWRVGSILASPPGSLFLMDVSRTGECPDFRS